MTATAKYLRNSLTVTTLSMLAYACDARTLASSTGDHTATTQALYGAESAAGAGSGEDAAASNKARHKHQHDHHASCGDGELQAGEQCDDGNTTSRDGCSASCGFDDDTSTPGDDRPGFMVCGTSNCATRDECCIDGSGSVRTCQLPGTTCSAVWGECDGPEDCSNGELCWEAIWPFCTAPDDLDPRGTRRCHADSDCQENTACMSGYCR